MSNPIFYLRDHLLYLSQTYIRDRHIIWSMQEKNLITNGAPDGWPLPPRKLIWWVIGRADSQLYLASGKAQVQHLLLPMLAKARIEYSALERVLDFGCGCGRLLRQLPKTESPEKWGVDFNPELIKWCRRHLTGMHFYKNQLNPPLPLESDQFDLILARSVFTHMPEQLMDQWLTELKRVLKPNGHLWLTFMGAQYLSRLDPQEKTRFSAGKMVIRNARYSGNNQCAAFHPRESVERFMERHDLLVKEFIPGGTVSHAGQDCYVVGRQ